MTDLTILSGLKCVYNIHPTYFKAEKIYGYTIFLLGQHFKGTVAGYF